MSTQHATRVTGDIVAVPDQILPTLKAAAIYLLSPVCEEVGRACDCLSDKGEDEQAAMRVELEQLLATIRALNAKGTVALAGTVIAPIVSEAIMLQTERIAEAAAATSADAFDEIERTSCLVRRLRTFEHELRTTGKVA
jgi:hypothetical protein